MKFVLDTNIVSAVMTRRAPVTVRLARVRPSEVGVPQPVFAEIAYGIERLPSSKRRAELAARFELLRTDLPAIRWSDGVSDEFGRIKATLERHGERLEDFDVAVAAHALALDAVLITANVKHMSRVSRLEIENWLEA
jgi:tRNA(fMet)-specific endonuclease VapC